MTDLFADPGRIVVGKNKAQFWIDNVETDDYSFKIMGWIYVLGIHNWKLETKIDFVGDSHSFSCKAAVVRRGDVSHDHGKGKVNYDESGFFVEVPRQNIGPDRYNISLTLKRKKTGETILSYPFLCMEVR